MVAGIFNISGETLKDSIFGVKPSILALRVLGGVLVVAPLAEKASLLGSQFDSKQCREKFVTLLSSLHQCRCISFAFRTSVLQRLLFNLDTYLDMLILLDQHHKGAATQKKKVADIIAVSIICRKPIRLGSFPEC